MQCVILAAGKGTRMRPLTETVPKPLITVCQTPLIEHVVAALPKEITELIIVHGYLGDQIQTYCGREYMGRTVRYAEQINFAGGTGDALMCARKLVTGKFLFMYADDIHGSAALEEAIQHEHAILAAYSDEPQNFGVLLEDESGRLTGVIEKPKNPPNNKVNIGGFVLQPSIFDYEVAHSAEHGELLVTDMITAYAQDNPVDIVMQSLWIPVGKPEDIAKAEAILCPPAID